MNYLSDEITLTILTVIIVRTIIPAGMVKRTKYYEN